MANNNGNVRRFAPAQPRIIEVKTENCEKLICPSCEGDVFTQGFRLYRVSGLIAQTAQDLFANVQTPVCVHCQTALNEEVPVIRTQVPPGA